MLLSLGGRGAPAVVFSRSQRAPAGIKRQPGTRPTTMGTLPTKMPSPARRHGPWATSQSPSHPKGGWGRNLPNCVPSRTAPFIGSQQGSTLPSRAKLTAPTPAEGNNAAGPSGAGQSGSVEAGPPATHAPARPTYDSLLVGNRRTSQFVTLTDNVPETRTAGSTEPLISHPLPSPTTLLMT